MGSCTHPPAKRRPGGWRRARIALLAAAAGGLASCCAIDRAITRAITQPPRRDVGAAVPEGMLERNFPVSAKVTLRAWIAEPEGEASAVVFVLHGISDSKATQAGTLAFLAERGITGIAPDLRAHGESGGEHATYGYLEKRDLSQLRKAVEKEYPGVPVGLWGTSYGGAVALQAMGVDPEFDFAIIENTFADLQDVARDQVLIHTGGLPLGRIGTHFINRAGMAAGFDAGNVSPERSIERVKVPVLHMHGGRDEVIPFEHGRRIARHARQENYRFVPIEQGTHYRLAAGDPATYTKEIAGFLEQVAPRK